MPEVVMKGIYDEVTDATEKKPSLFLNMYYYLKLRKIAKKVDWSLYIEKNKDVCNGKPVIKGTRITPETIHYYFLSLWKKGNDTNKIISEIMQNYPSLDESTIAYALIYVIRKKGLKLLFE